MVELAHGSVHLWTLQLDHHHRGDDIELLDAAERARAARFRFEHHRRRFVTHRAWLRRLLALYAGRAAAALEFRLIANDKPALLADGGVSDFEFNLSHSDALALCGITRGTGLGVDLECRRPITDALAIGERHFGPRELAWVRAGGAQELMSRFFTVWTRKEAFIKATGEGLSRELASFDVRPDVEGSVEVSERHPAAQPWYVQSFSLDGDVAAALCSRLPQPALVWPALPAGCDPALRRAMR